MKNIYKLSVGIMLVTVVGLNSCVKNEVSPEVTALRKGQLDKLKAEIALTQLEARNDRMQITFDSLNQALKLRQDEQSYLAFSAQIDMQIQSYKTQQAQNQLAYEQALAAYQRFVASGSFAQNVQDLLGKYNDESQVLMQLYNDRITLQKQIAIGQLLLNGSGLKFDVVKARLEEELATSNSQLDAAKAALPLLESVLQNPTAIQDQLIDLYINIGKLEGKYDSLAVEYDKAYNAWQAAEALVAHANFVINIMDNWDPIYHDGYLNDLKPLNDNLVSINANITSANATIALLNTTLTTAINSLASATTAYNAKYALLNTATNNLNNANNDVVSKTVLRDIAQNNYNADPTPANQTLLNTANTNLTTANTTQSTRQTEYNTALANSNAAKSTMNSALSYKNTAQNNVDNQTNVVKNLNQNKTETETNIAIVTAKIAEWQTEYDNAKTNIASLEENATLLSKKHILVSIEGMKISDLISQMEHVRYSLEDNYSNITYAIDDLKESIKNLEDDVTSLETQIANNTIDKTWAEGNVTKLQALLATTEIKITLNTGIVAQWKKLLDEAIAAQN